MVRYNPDGYIPSSGRKVKEDGSVVNIADLIENLVNNGIEVKGSNLAEQLTEADAVDGTLTYTEPIKTIQIYNGDPENVGHFLVNGRTIHVPPSTLTDRYNLVGSESTTVTVTGATSYIVSRFE